MDSSWSAEPIVEPTPLCCRFPQGLFAMRAEEEVLPMVLSRSGPTAPEDLRAIVRPEVARREKTMVLVRDTFRRYASPVLPCRLPDLDEI